VVVVVTAVAHSNCLPAVLLPCTPLLTKTADCGCAALQEADATTADELKRLLAAAGKALQLASKLLDPESSLTELECQKILDYFDQFHAWRARCRGGVAEVESDDDDDDD